VQVIVVFLVARTVEDFVGEGEGLAVGVDVTDSTGDGEGVGVTTGVGVGLEEIVVPEVGLVTGWEIKISIVGVEKVKFLAERNSQPFFSLTNVVSIFSSLSPYVIEIAASTGALVNP
jgi:hypothetical protein